MYPQHNEITSHLLTILADGKVYTTRVLLEKLTQEQSTTLKEQSSLGNRMRWARTRLKEACLIQCLSRRRCKISYMGEEVLRQNPQALDAHLTEQLPKFEKAKRRQDLKISSTLSLAQSERGIKSESSPEDALRANYQTLRQSLAADILGKIKRVSPAFFEQLVVDVLVAMGYGGSQPNAAQTLGRSGDGGVDGVIKEDKLGLEVIYIQAKRWENPVGRPEVQAFAGSLEGFRARKGVFITTSRFTKDARDYVERISSRIILIDGQYLAELMMDHNVGSSEYECFVIKKLNSTYFDEK